MKYGAALLFSMLACQWLSAQINRSTWPPVPLTAIPPPNIYKPLPRWVLHASLIAPGIIAGIAQGQNDVTRHNIWGYRYRHPYANENWWNSDSSWRIANGNSWAAANFTAFTKDKEHLNQAIATVMISGQMAVVAVWTIDDMKRSTRKPVGKMLLHIGLRILEANAARLLAKRATIAFYDVY